MKIEVAIKCCQDTEYLLKLIEDYADNVAMPESLDCFTDDVLDSHQNPRGS